MPVAVVVAVAVVAVVAVVVAAAVVVVLVPNQIHATKLGHGADRSDPTATIRSPLFLVVPLNGPNTNLEEKSSQMPQPILA